MDAKNLETLQRLESDKKTGKSGHSHHVPGQGFSDESERFFADLAVRKREAIDKQLAEEKAQKPPRELDEVTRELRSEFALLNKIYELREIAKQPSTKQSKRAAKAALREARRVAKQSKPVKSKKTPKASKQDLLPVSKWIPKICWRCKAKFSIHADWERPPSLCKACTKEIDETHLPSRPSRSTPSGWVHFVSGGAPSLGKRR